VNRGIVTWKRIHRVLGFVLACALLLTAMVPPRVLAQAPRSAGPDNPIIQKYRQLIPQLMAEQDISGLAVAVVDDTRISSMIVAAYSLSLWSLLMSALVFWRLRAPMGFIPWIPKLAAGALSPIWFVFGLLGLVLGLLKHAPLAAAAGALGMVCMVWYLWKITRSKLDFEVEFGSDWQKHIAPQREKGLLTSRWVGLLLEPDRSKACLHPDIPFWTIPGTSRQLLCDIWQPSASVTPSGLSVIFFHGSAWYMLNKDFGTRPFFSHLVAQGHVVMDVAYRLCPEVDVFDMVGDVKRAVAWMKRSSSQYGVNPQRLILGGASAGGHLSLLAAYALQEPHLTPDELKDADLSVHGVISLYGPSDLGAVYYHTNQQRLVGLPKVAVGPEAAQGKKNMRDAGRLDILVGGHLSEVPEAYNLASPITHVHPGCPPTLLIQGNHDLITPIAATRRLVQALVEAGVPAISLEFPYVDHAFDLMLPFVSPSYQSALYAIDRFLAMME
jgi:acetyl esterase/lipase